MLPFLPLFSPPSQKLCYKPINLFYVFSEDVNCPPCVFHPSTIKYLSADKYSIQHFHSPPPELWLQDNTGLPCISLRVYVGPSSYGRIQPKDVVRPFHRRLLSSQLYLGTRSPSLRCRLCSTCLQTGHSLHLQHRLV